MSAPSNTFLTTAAVGNREDLIEVITRITPSKTAFFSMIGTTTATNTLHEFQTQDLAAPAANAQAEGDDATATAAVPTVRLNNRTQISTKTASVSGSQEAANSAGRKSEMAYQMSLKALELRTDMELGLTQNTVTATSPRSSRGLPGWVVDNVDAGSGYVAPSYTANTGLTDASTRIAFTEARLKNVLQKIFTAGGSPTTIMMGPVAKQTFSTFTGNATRMDKSEDSKLYASVDVYASDFGEIKAVPNRIQRARDIFVLQPDTFSVAYYRKFMTTDLAKTGDSDRKMITVEYCLEARAPKANGGIYDNL